MRHPSTGKVKIQKEKVKTGCVVLKTVDTKQEESQHMDVNKSTILKTVRSEQAAQTYLSSE